MKFTDLLIALRRRWRVIAIITAATIAVAWITTPGIPKQRTERKYEASQDLVTISNNPRAGQWDRWAFDATNGPVPRAVAGAVGGAPVSSAGDKTNRGDKQIATILVGDDSFKVTVTPDPNIGRLRLAVVSTNRDLAVQIADVYATTLITALQTGSDRTYVTALADLQTRQIDYDKQVSVWTNRKALCAADGTGGGCRNEAQTRMNEFRSLARQTHGDVLRKLREGKKRVDIRANQTDASDQPHAYVKPAPEASASKIPQTAKPRIAGGFLLGLLLGCMVAFMISRFDSAVYGIASTEAAARLPVLAEIPHVTTTRRRRFEVLTQLSPLSGVADSYRGLRTSIGLMWLANESETGQNEPRTLLVASPGPNEGKSTSSANLAAAYAEIGKKVVVVDLDFRRQRLHRFLGANAEPYLENTGSLANPIVDLESVMQTTSIPGVHFIGSASPDSTPAEAAVAGRAAILAAREIADIVIIDTPPLLLTNDTFDLIDLSDAVILLARDAKTKTAALSRAGQQLRRLDAPVVGIALIGAISSRPGYGYGYGYGYRYGYSYGYGYGSRHGVTQAAASRVVEKAAELQNDPEDGALLTEAPPTTAPRGRFARRGRRLDITDESSSDVDHTE